MKQAIIYALDFDGVLCDSVLETGISAWKAASQIWDDFPSPLPSMEISQLFRQIRPVMGTGYESILIIRMLNDGDTVTEILHDYENKKQQIIDNTGLDIDSLKKLFGETRDSWINEDITEWIQMNPLFQGIEGKLQSLSAQGVWYIVTTKQERFVKQILAANKVHLPDENIFGLDRNKTKAEILVELMSRHKEQSLYFVEDMLPALLKVKNHSQLTSVKLFLADWGYNQQVDRVNVDQHNIELINIESFLD